MKLIQQIIRTLGISPRVGSVSNLSSAWEHEGVEEKRVPL